MNRTPIIRKRKLVGSPFNGMSYDLKKLRSLQECKEVENLIDDAKQGKSITSDDLKTLMRLRKNARVSTPAARLSEVISEMKDVFR